jgi:hypothetical protein
MRLPSWSSAIAGLRPSHWRGHGDDRAAAVALRHLTGHFFADRKRMATAVALKLNRHAPKLLARTD